MEKAIDAGWMVYQSKDDRGMYVVAIAKGQLAVTRRSMTIEGARKAAVDSWEAIYG